MLIDTHEIDFGRLYEDHAQALFGFLAYRTGNPALAEDVLGEAFERALRFRGSFDPEKAGAKTWLYTIALNCLRDRMRRAGAEERALQSIGADGGRSQLELARVDDRDELQRALSGLSDEEREAVALRYGAEMTAPEMADVLRTRLTTVEGRLYRALRKLRADLA